MVVDQFSNTYNPRPIDPTVAGATPGDMAGLFVGEAYIGLEYDLRAEGTYTLRLTSSNGSAATNIHIVLTRLNRPCRTNTTLTCGRSLAGAISTTSRGQVDTYQFAVQAGDLVSFRLLRVASTGLPDTNTFFFFAIYANDPAHDNRPYAVNVDPKTNRLSFAQIYGHYEWTSTVSGTVTVVVFEYSGNLGGSYYLSATKLNGGCGGAALTCNSIVDGSLTSPLSFGFYTIKANGGDVYQFRTARPDAGGGFTPSAEIFNSQGVSVGVVTGGQRVRPCRVYRYHHLSQVGHVFRDCLRPARWQFGILLPQHASPQPALRWRTGALLLFRGGRRRQRADPQPGLRALRQRRRCVPGAPAASRRQHPLPAAPRYLRSHRRSDSVHQYHRPGARQFHCSSGRKLYPGSHRQFRQLAERFVFALPVAPQPAVQCGNAELRRAGPRHSSARAIQQRLHLHRRRRRILQRAHASQQRRSAARHRSLRRAGQPGGPAALRQLRRRGRDQAGGRRLHGAGHRFQQDARRLQFHARPAAHHQRLLRARRTGRDGERCGLVDGPVPGVSHRGHQRRCALPAQQFFHRQLRLPDGTLRSRRRAPGFRRLQPLPQGCRFRQLHGDPGRRHAAHRGRIQLRLAASESAGRRNAARLRRFHHGRALCQRISSATTRSPPTPATRCACSSPASATISRRRWKSSTPRARASPPIPTSPRRPPPAATTWWWSAPLPVSPRPAPTTWPSSVPTTPVRRCR